MYFTTCVNTIHFDIKLVLVGLNITTVGQVELSTFLDLKDQIWSFCDTIEIL